MHQRVKSNIATVRQAHLHQRQRNGLELETGRVAAWCQRLQAENAPLCRSNGKLRRHLDGSQHSYRPIKRYAVFLKRISLTLESFEKGLLRYLGDVTPLSNLASSMGEPRCSIFEDALPFPCWRHVQRQRLRPITALGLAETDFEDFPQNLRSLEQICIPGQSDRRYWILVDAISHTAHVLVDTAAGKATFPDFTSDCDFRELPTERQVGNEGMRAL